MISQQTIDAARDMNTLTCAYFNAVSQEIGEERALQLIAEVYDRMGLMQGQLVKQQANIHSVNDAQAAYRHLIPVFEGYGLNWELVEDTPQSIVYRTMRCPFYEAAQKVGIDAEAMCHAGPKSFMNAFLQQLNPHVHFEIRHFRSSADDACVEAVVLE